MSLGATYDPLLNTGVEAGAGAPRAGAVGRMTIGWQQLQMTVTSSSGKALSAPSPSSTEQSVAAAARGAETNQRAPAVAAVNPRRPDPAQFHPWCQSVGQKTSGSRGVGGEGLHKK